MPVFVRLLGRPMIESDGSVWEPTPERHHALMLYLAHADGWVSRDDLLYLFWPDSEEGQARANLRQLIAKARALPFATDLQTDRTRIRWPVTTDLQSLTLSLESRRVPESGKWPGPLLDDFRLPRTPEFDSWLELERSDLHERCRALVLEAAESADHEGQWHEAVRLLDGWLARAPLDEEAVRAIMRSAYAIGRYDTALARFTAFEASLAREVGLQPERSTLELVTALRAERVLPVAVASDLHGESSRGQRRSGRPAQGFVGRISELERLTEELVREGALVTILAPGGMGKTRLAMVAAQRLGRLFEHGVAAARLAGVHDADGVGSALLLSLGLESERYRPPLEQVEHALADRRMLLVLDNVEQVAGLAGIVEDLMNRAPSVSWLLTSRERVGLRDESVLELHGLPFADGPASIPRRQSDAVELFTQLAHRAGKDLDPERDGPHVLRVCRATGGMPLALELAAGWLRVLPIDRIADEIEEGIELLAATDVGRDPRHTSMAVVFESSWHALSVQERSTLVALAAFRGGFTEEAARTVADTGRPMLLALRNKSFLLLEQSGRFYQHPLLETFVRSRAVDDAVGYAAARERHARYFCEYLGLWEDQGQSGLGLESDDALSSEHANLEQAWFYAVDAEWWDVLKKGGASLGLSYVSVGRPFRWNELLLAALDRVPQDSPTWALLEAHEASMAMFAGRNQEAYDRRSHAVTLLRGMDDRFSLAWVLLLFAQSAESRGRSAEAKSALREAHAIWTDLGEHHLVGQALTNLLSGEDDPDERERLYLAGEENWRVSGNPYNFVISSLEHAVFIAGVYGEYQAAFDLVDGALALVREQKWPAFEEVRALRLSAEFQLAAGDFVAARSKMEVALRLWPMLREVFPHGESQLRAQLARVLHGQGDVAGAVEILESDSATGSTFDGLLVRSDVALHSGDASSALELANRALLDLSDAPASDWRARFRRVRALLSCARAAVELGDVAAARADVAAAVDLAITWRYLPAVLRACAGALPLLPTELASAVRAWVAGHGAAEYVVRRALSDTEVVVSANTNRAARWREATDFAARVQEALGG